MGSIVFEPKVLVDTLSELVGYKAGLALSIEEMCDHLKDSYADDIRASEEGYIRLRAEDYEALFHKLLYRIGHTEEEFDGDMLGTFLWHKYKQHHEIVGAVKGLYTKMWMGILSAAAPVGKELDPMPFLEEAERLYGPLGWKIAWEQVQAIDRGLRLSPNTRQRYVEWSNVESLKNLFQDTQHSSEHGIFIDQRFIDFLDNNQEQLSNMHWRKFEALTAEFFSRCGFKVELGPGRNDDGVDVRIWRADHDVERTSPTCIVQCKREKQKVSKVVVKGLYADLRHEGAEYGLIVTSNELSVGARRTIHARGYPIQEANSKTLAQWLDVLRTPGTGIVRV